MTKETDRILGTAEFIAPEIIKGGLYTQLVDLFSLGLVLFEAVLKKTFYHVLFGEKATGDKLIKLLADFVHKKENEQQVEINEKLNLYIVGKESEDFGSVSDYQESIKKGAWKAYEKDYSDKPEFLPRDFTFMLVAMLQVIFFYYILL